MQKFRCRTLNENRRDYKRAKDEFRKQKKEHPEYKRCFDCGGWMVWCSCCETYTKTCCVDYGTCMCS